jgi:hypothetical protein
MGKGLWLIIRDYTGRGRYLKEKKPMSSGWSLYFGVVENDPGGGSQDNFFPTLA